MIDDEILQGEPAEPTHEIKPLHPEVVPHGAREKFADYKVDGRNWITLATGEYYPDILAKACLLYEPVLVTFGQLLRESESSIRFFMKISEEANQWMRVQLARVFRKYVSPETPVEMLKKKANAKKITEEFGDTFRPIHEVQAAFDTRPMPDEALCALLWEYKDRGKKGYDFTARFFEIFKERFPALTLIGPERAGKDIALHNILPSYPNPKRPVDFIVKEGDEILAVGLARYDGDRGGAQEDDRTGGYIACSDEILGYAKAHGHEKLKVIFLNDGPGLLLGSMWNDYSTIENRGAGRVMVLTLRMVPERMTLEWLRR
jgi:hypothetical protein